MTTGNTHFNLEGRRRRLLVRSIRSASSPTSRVPELSPLKVVFIGINSPSTVLTAQVLLNL